jgi:hypothetical protein
MTIRPISTIALIGLSETNTIGCYAQSQAENVFSRFKRTFGARLWAKREASQEREASLACQLLNRMRELGCPESYVVN